MLRVRSASAGYNSLATRKRQLHETQLNVVACGKLIMDPGRHLCTWDKAPIDLTKTGFALLAALARYPGYVKSRDQLIDEIRGPEICVLDRTIDSHIKRLRKKFRAADREFANLQTVWGIGYRYRE